jgi:hypothetical protein
MDNLWRATGSFAALHCRLYSAAPPALRRVVSDTLSADQAGQNLCATAPKGFCSVWLRDRAPKTDRIKAFYSTAPMSLLSVWLRDRARKADQIKAFCSTAPMSLLSVWLGDRAPEARRIKARSAAERNSGTDITTTSQTPDKGWRRTPCHK